ncbi:MAG: hypothetical protein CL677_07500 [Bdellovibrionaceae bacterium]|nr:hypothetical protein [Pseudobdellovibrionaceae bacterium]|tara:strand:+ start:43357 stop:45138 length:1782 start_codon:yes stop_codon:yes gene_type:complete
MGLFPSLRKYRTIIFQHLDLLVTFLGLTSIAVCLLRYGFNLSSEVEGWVRIISPLILVIFTIQEMVRIPYTDQVVAHLKDRWFEISVALVGLFYFTDSEIVRDYFRVFHPEVELIDVVLIYLAISHFFVLLKTITQILRRLRYLESLSLGPTQIFILSFLVPIGIGTLLLKLPKATVESISWVDALFTATSSICVTGLVVLPTDIAFTSLGKVIICGLFQIGGLGMMTLTVFFSSFLSGHLGVGEKTMLSNWLSVKQLGRVSELLTHIFVFTFFIEMIGAIGLYLSGGHSFAAFKPFVFYEAVFHSISAFCNAGFSLSPSELTQAGVVSNKGYPSIIMILIILGGLGFPVISNFWRWIQFRLGRLREGCFSFSVHTKLVVLSTTILLVFGTFAIYLLERNSSFADLSTGETFFHSLFWSVTSRTAGFNIWPTEALSSSTVFVLIGLMWIGASPSSTGGGVKNVTVLVAFMEVISQIKGKRSVTIFGREISQDSIRRAFTMIFLSMIMLASSVFIILFLEPHINRVDLVFEVVSAWGTVGLSRGITADLQIHTKFFISAIMIIGRVGIFSILISIVRKGRSAKYELPKESIIIH